MRFSAMDDSEVSSLESGLMHRLDLASRNACENRWMHAEQSQPIPLRATREFRKKKLRKVSFPGDQANDNTKDTHNNAEYDHCHGEQPQVEAATASGQRAYPISQSRTLHTRTTDTPEAKESTINLPTTYKMENSKRQAKPRLLLMGQRRSGKSSITSVVFHKMEPQETLFLESTTRVQKDTMNSFMDFQVWDFPGQLDYFDPTFDTTQMFSDIGALIWVVDAQDDYSDSLARLTTTIINLQNTFPHINVEVFVHKTDSLNEDYRSDIFQDIVQRVGDDLNDAGFINPNVSYHLTSIYDSSIFEALSSVIQKLIPELDVLQNLLNTLINNSGMTKAYLFDILSKIYVASDTRPVDSDIYEICANYIDLTVDFTDLYNYPRDNMKILGEQMEEVESSMTFEDGTMVYLKEMNKHLCLVTVIKNKEAKDKKGMIDYNVHIFQEALKAVFDRAWEKNQDADGGIAHAAAAIKRAGEDQQDDATSH